MHSCKFAPDLVLLHLFLAQAVVVGGNIGFERCYLPFASFFPEKFIQNRRLGVRLATSCFLLQVCQTLRRECEGSPQFAASIGSLHLTLYHTINMITGERWPNTIEFWCRLDAASRVSTGRLGKEVF